MKLRSNAPYVSDSEALFWARIIEPMDTRLARRIRRGVWKRRVVAAFSGVMVLAGSVLIFMSIALLGRP